MRRILAGSKMKRLVLGALSSVLVSAVLVAAPGIAPASTSGAAVTPDVVATVPYQSASSYAPVLPQMGVALSFGDPIMFGTNWGDHGIPALEFGMITPTSVGSTLWLDESAADFAEMANILTDGQSTAYMRMWHYVCFVGGFCYYPGSQPVERPDLAGYVLTRIGFRVDSVSFENGWSLEGAFLFEGLPVAVADIAALIEQVYAIDANQGIVASLDTKLQAVQEALVAANAGNRADACNKLEAFIQAVKAQSGKALTEDQATAFVTAAQEIVTELTLSAS